MGGAVRAVCPKDSTHDRFITTAHVVEEWVVTPEGDWTETVRSIETTHPPDKRNEWVCTICRSIVEVWTPHH